MNSIAGRKTAFLPGALLLFFTFFALPAGLFAQSGEAAQSEDWYLGKTIKSVGFNGIKNVSRSELDGIFEVYKGRMLTEELYLEILGAVNALEYFEGVTRAGVVPAGNSSIVLTFDVTERPVVAAVRFSGNRKLRTGTLRDVVTVKTGDIYRPEQVATDKDNVMFKYVEGGFSRVKVEARIAENRNGSMNITFEITEGKRTTVADISFAGNRRFSERTLKSQISMKEKGLIASGAFEEIKLVNDRLIIEQYYHNRGYINARVVDIVRKPSELPGGDESVDIIFQLDEGDLYTFEGVIFKGNYVFTARQLEDLIRSKKGQYVNASKLEADLQRVYDLYRNNGYIFSDFSRRELLNREEKTLQYELDISEYDRAYIEKITVKFMDDSDPLKKGKHKTRPFVITRELPFEEGDIFSKAKIEDAIRNLYNLQYFADVRTNPVQGSEFGLMEVDITVEEQPTTDIQAGLTFSGSTEGELPISLLVKWTDRNFLGRGNVFGVSANVSPDVQNASVEYTQKWLFGLPLSGGFDFTIQHAARYGFMDNQPPFFTGGNDDSDYAFPDGFDSYTDFYNSGKAVSDEYLFKYEQWTVSMGFSTGYRWRTPLGSLSTGGGIRVGFKINNYDRELYRAFDQTIREHPDPMPATSFFLSLSLDNRDVFYDPTRGYYVVQRLGFYGLLPEKLEEEYYTRSDSKAEIFFTLWNWQVTESWAFRGVLGFHSGFSFILPSAYDPSGPVIEDANKLYVDGMFIGRGWTDERTNYGYALWENWAELRVPVVPGIISLDFLFDAVEIARKYDLFDGGIKERMKFSTGGGFRFAIPQFPFRFIFVKRFDFNKNGELEWMEGPVGGLDFVLSFALSTY